MLEAIWPSNRFYGNRLRRAGLGDPRDLRSLENLVHLPLTTKRELIQDQEASPPFGTNLGCLGMPLIRYRTGDAVKVNDTPCPCGRHSRRAKGGIVGRVERTWTCKRIERGGRLFTSPLDPLSAGGEGKPNPSPFTERAG